MTKLTLIVWLALASISPSFAQINVQGTNIQIGPKGIQGPPGCIVGTSSCSDVIASQPNNSQTVMQPTGTSLTLNGTTTADNLNGVRAVVGGDVIQDAIDAASTNGAVDIPANYSGNDTYANPNGISISDRRQQTTNISVLTSIMTPFLTQLGPGAGGDLKTLAMCIAKGGPCVVDGIGNSILGSGGVVYENGIWPQIMTALRAQYPTVTFTGHNYTLGGRGAINGPSYPQLPLCPTNAPACYTLTSGFPYNTVTYNAGYGYANPPSGTTNASYGTPFFGADDFPWPGSPEPDFTHWTTAAVNDNPDAVFFLFSMNDEASQGYQFVANLKLFIAEFTGLSKVPSIILIAGSNGSISPTGQSYFTPTAYSNLDEFAEDLRGMAKQYGYGLIDGARLFSSLRDGSDPANPIWQLDTNYFNNFTNPGYWSLFNTTGTITNGGYTWSQNGIGKIAAVRQVLTRDSLIAGVWDTTDVHVIPFITWRNGYTAQLTNDGSGNFGVTVYSAHGPGSGIAQATGTGLTNSTSFMVEARGNEYRVWVNGKLLIGPDTTTGYGFDYDNIGYGYSGVGTDTSATGTPFSSSINHLTIEYASPQKSCSLPIPNRQSSAPCSPGTVTDQDLYGFNTGILGGNQINHPTVYGTLGVYGIAMVPFLSHLQSTVAGYNITYPALKSLTGTRYVCIGTDGKLVSSPTACSGT